jgi:hypothetical protein
MADDYNTTREDKSPKGDHKDILAQVRKDWDAADERERTNIKLAYEDLEFLAGDNLSQWPEKQRKEREDDGRPTLQINQLPQFVRQITGDIRQMRPAIKVVPVDSEADEKVAELRAGLIRYIENRSDAAAIYFRAADSQVSCGIGHWRVVTEYADSSTFNQEIRIAPIEDGVAVRWDPDSVLPSREDARFCFVPVDMSRNAFEAQYPGVTPSEFDDAEWSGNQDWCADDYVRVSEYWIKKPTKKLLALQLDGAIADVTDAEPSVIEMYQSKGARIEKRDSTKVCRYLVTASQVLEGPEDWPGRFIPIVPVLGEETRIGRRIIRSGVVRNAKDAQRMSNYFHSAHTETVALQPKAPFMVTETNVAKYQPTWEQANTKNFPYLPYEPDTKNGGAAPQRIQPPVSSQGILDGLTMAKEDLRSIIGIYDASLGKQSNETSGRAILARQKEGDTGSYLYIDNFGRSVRQTGNIINDLIPHVYDTERTIRIMGEDGKIDVMEINKASGIDPQSGETIYDHDITVGSYDVVAQMGPSYTTKREEAREGMIAFLQAAPDAAPIILDLVAKAQDWPMADDIAKRFRANLPPQILKMEEMEKQGATPEQIQQFMDQERQNQPPPPEVQKAQMDAQLSQQKMQGDMEMSQAKLQQDSQVAVANHDLQRMKIEADIQLAREKAAAEIQLAREKCEAEMQMKAHECEQRMVMDRETRDMKMHEQREDREAKKSEKPSAVVQLGSDEAAKGVAEAVSTLNAGVAQNGEAMTQIAQMIAQTAQMMAQAANQMAQAAQISAAPKRVIKDSAGSWHVEPIGIQ